MNEANAKLLRRVEDQKMFMFWCPGCKCAHWVNDTWQVNTETLTITPSVRVSGGKDNTTLCHLFVTNGKIQFLSDSAHELAGQTVPMEEL